MKHILESLLVTGLLLSSGGAVAQTAPPARLTFNIESQRLDTALTQFAQATGLQLLFPTNVAMDQRAPKVSGSLTPEAALQLLLKDSGLSYQYVNPKTVAIRSKGAGNKDSALLNADGKPGVLLAQAGAASAGDGVEEMLVEGERDRPAPFSTANLDLTRTEDDPLPFTVFTAKDISLSGAVNLQDFLQNRLPQNFNPDIPDEMDGAGDEMLARSSRVNLRGWGEGETVFLLNGRRLSAEYQGGMQDHFNATPNLQGIALASIERIEILSSAGSAIYGANATGGVINIITRQDFRGGMASLSYETPADAHAPRRSVDLSYGLPLSWGMGLRLMAGLNESRPLQVGDRADVSIERWRRLALERAPARLINVQGGNPFRTSSQLRGATPNIRAMTTTITGKPGNLFADLSGAQASNFTTVPDGRTGGGLSDFRPGVYNLDLAEGAAGGSYWAKGSTLGRINSNIVFGAGMDKRLGDEWRWSLDYRYSENSSEGRPSGALTFSSTSAAGANPRVPMAAPTNPFGQDVRVYLIDPRLQRPELVNKPHNSTWGLSSTLRGAVGEWRGFLDVTFSENRNDTVSNYFHEPDGGWNQAFLDGDYNPFVDGRVVAPAAPEFYENYILRRYFYGSGTRNYLGSLRASGPILSLPAGAAQLTGGIEWSRADRYKSFFFGQYQDAQTYQPRTPFGQTSDVFAPYDEHPSRRFVFDNQAAYAELTIPLLSSAQDVPLLGRLELFGSARLDRGVRSSVRVVNMTGASEPYEYVDNSHLTAFGFGYDILEGVSLRATRSVGFKPPPMYALMPTPVQEGYEEDYVLTVTDVRRNEIRELTVDMWSFGGNMDLRPETSTSTNFGLILKPRWAPGLRVSVDYLENVRDDAIYAPQVWEILTDESAFPGLVQRGEPDGHPSGVGPVTFVDTRYTNLNQIASRSVDFSVEQQLQSVFGGRLTFTLAGTKNLSFLVQTVPTSPPVDTLRDVNSAFSQQIEWNANGQLLWEGRQWSFGWGARYFDYILMYPDYYAFQGGDRAPWAVNHDVNVSYRAGKTSEARGLRWLLSGSSVTFGVKNVFDRKPRFWAPNTDQGVAPYDSIVGRSVWLRLNKSFD